ncbi:hypothetical protein GCM10010435_88200 [Winogradskya consettensis]|uniref:M23ase beta-sheet core domain-containing protein n=2 Tax=Winogradskya consettensis TaxID=113560 RepID=A0A919T2D5_9ACTN|nr:hypothetical protein Aco04nite_91210 [Actinoplanes consettensis]
MAAALVAGVSVSGVAIAGESATPAGATGRAPSVTTSPITASSTALSPGALNPAALSKAALSKAALNPAVSPVGGASAAGTSVDAGPKSGVAGVSPIGGLDLGEPFVVQKRKVKPLPLWINPMPEGSVTSCFGERWGRLHAGVDLAAPSGTPIRAAGAGVVVSAGPADGYGNAVLIDHGNGYLTHYGHMSVITVVAGQQVKVGDQIGNEGSTGHSTGPHLHFEVHKGTYKNPIEPTQWMHEHGVDINGCVAFAG